MSMMGPYNLLHRDKDGIGFTFYYYQKYMAPQRKLKNRKFLAKRTSPGNPEPLVEMLAINGVKPSRYSISNGTYPWVTRVYAVTRDDIGSEHPAVKLLDWLKTEKGQKIIEETGYIPGLYR